jgi:16S rRNA A1518/A1519 N6-dimethyltransferase RsmA/KsgA/DIM1 with predicted DNA glycosylase/AP lyase activity
MKPWSPNSNTTLKGTRYVRPEMGTPCAMTIPLHQNYGNLPYYITSGIVEKILFGANHASRVVLMVQKEAADRLLAKPGSKEYSPLSLYLNYVATVKRAFNVARTAFVPAPHIESTVLTIDLLPEKHDDESASDVSVRGEALPLSEKNHPEQPKNVPE